VDTELPLGPFDQFPPAPGSVGQRLAVLMVLCALKHHLALGETFEIVDKPLPGGSGRKRTGCGGIWHDMSVRPPSGSLDNVDQVYSTYFMGDLPKCLAST
jgi:hypothetical protein